MYNPTWQQTTCDSPSCNKLLHGRDRLAYKRVDHLEIKGQILTQRYVNEKNFWTYVTDRPEEGKQPVVYVFCNSSCLSDYIAAREAFLEDKRRDAKFARLREENTTEQNAELDQRKKYGY